MSRLEQERMILSYWGNSVTVVEDEEDNQTRVQDVQSRSEEIQEIQDEMLEDQIKTIKYIRKKEILLEQHINNYVGSNTADFLYDITHGEEEMEEVDMAFEAFIREEA